MAISEIKQHFFLEYVLIKVIKAKVVIMKKWIERLSMKTRGFLLVFSSILEMVVIFLVSELQNLLKFFTKTKERENVNYGG